MSGEMTPFSSKEGPLLPSEHAKLKRQAALRVKAYEVRLPANQTFRKIELGRTALGLTEADVAQFRLVLNCAHTYKQDEGMHLVCEKCQWVKTGY